VTRAVFKIPFHEKHASNFSNTQLRKVGDAAVAIHKTLLDAHNPAAVAELEHSVCGLDAATDHAKSSPSFTGKCDTGPATWY
jgi:hypothetical protein